MTPLTFQDWACGCGGWTEGLVQAGFKPVLGIDSWNIAAQSHHDNFAHLGCKTLVERMENITPEMLPDTDVIVGSPPCPNSSIANKGPSARTEDYWLLRVFLSLIEAKKPRWWALENGPLYWRDMPEELKARIPKCVVLAAGDYLGWHLRKRAFFGNFPDPLPGLYGKNHMVKKAKFRTPRASEHKKGDFPDNFARRFSTPTASEHHDYRTEGHRGLPVFWQYLQKRGQDVTLERMLWAMGFPPGYRLAGTRIDGIIQAGNAVCPPVAYALGAAMMGGN